MKLLRHLRSEFAHLHILYYCSLNLSFHFSYRVIGLQNLHLDDGSVEALMSQELLQSLKLRATMPQRDGMYVCLSYPVGFFGCCLFFFIFGQHSLIKFRKGEQDGINEILLSLVYSINNKMRVMNPIVVHYNEEPLFAMPVEDIHNALYKTYNVVGCSTVLQGFSCAIFLSTGFSSRVSLQCGVLFEFFPHRFSSVV